MNELSSVNTSFYPELAPGYAPKTLQAVVGIKNDQYSQRLDANSYVDESDYQKAEVNLNNYYAQTKIENFMAIIFCFFQNRCFHLWRRLCDDTAHSKRGCRE